jgi:thiosulfate/3-mercaptopyruvate sulfurtransferase
LFINFRAWLPRIEKGETVMKKLPVFLIIAAVAVCNLPSFAFASPAIDPIVSTEWLADHRAEVIIVDVRGLEDYGAGHIPGSINEPLIIGIAGFCTGPVSNWITGNSECVWMEMPDKGDLFKTIGNLGITKNSWVVIVSAPGAGEPPFYGLSGATRVADALIYAGVKNVAILDGGYPKWAAEDRPVSTDVPGVTPIPYSSPVKEGMFVTIEYVLKKVGKSVIIDGRDPDTYFGVTMDPFLHPENGLGHIPSARSLPAPWVWEKGDNETYDYYLYKDKKILEAMAAGVIGHKNKEIIVYCSVGGYASTWWFLLTRVLEYENVKFFDGSAQEWAIKGYDFVPYEWE